MTMAEHAVGYILLPVTLESNEITSLDLVTIRQGGWRSRIVATRHAEEVEFEVEVASGGYPELLQAAGRVVQEHKLPHELRLLPVAAAAVVTADATADAKQTGPAAAATECTATAAITTVPATTTSSSSSCCIQLIVGLHNLLLQGIGWKRSAAAAVLFKQLVPITTDPAAAVHHILLGPSAANNQQQQQQGLADQGPAPGRYTLLSCFRELPSVSTAPPPTAISITQQQQQLDKLPKPTAAAAAGHTGSSSSSSSLADIPSAVMQQLLGLLSAADLASLACCCRGLRSVTWEAVPGLKLILYPHQRNALSWMLHREVHGGQMMNHPFIVKFVTDTGIPVYLNQVTGELSADPAPHVSDIRGGFFCDEPGLGKTVTALSLILKTQGITPTPPVGAHVTWLKAPTGRKVGFYTPADTLGLAAEVQGMVSSQPGNTWQQQQQQGLAAAGGGQGNYPGALAQHSVVPNPAVRRSNSYNDIITKSGSVGFKRSGVLSSVRQGAWALAPSLRSSSSRRRARSEAAAAEVAAAAASAAAAAAQEPTSGSSRKRNRPSLSVPPPTQQQQQRNTVVPHTAAAAAAGSSVLRTISAARAAAIEVVTTPYKKQTAAAAVSIPQAPVAAAEDTAAAAAGSTAATAAAAAASILPLAFVPARAAAMKASQQIRCLLKDTQQNTSQILQAQQQQQQQASVKKANDLLRDNFTPTKKAACNGQSVRLYNQSTAPLQQQQQGFAAAAAAAAAGSTPSKGSSLQSPRRQAALKAASSIHNLYQTVEAADAGSGSSSDDELNADDAVAAAGAAKRVRSATPSSRPDRKGVKVAATGNDKDLIGKISNDSGYNSDDISSDESSDDVSGSDYSQEKKRRSRTPRKNVRRNSSKQLQHPLPSKTAAAAAAHYTENDDEDDHQPCKKRRLNFSSLQQQCTAAAAAARKHAAVRANDCYGAAAAAADTKDLDSDADDHDLDAGAGDDDGNWVMCDHCSKWRTLPQGYQVSANTPWFCCLHPNPDLASCLIPEEDHDGNNMSYNIDSDNEMKYSYTRMVGFIPLQNAQQNAQCTAAAAAAAVDESNVAHFVAVINATAEVGDPYTGQQLLLWLSEQPPENFVTQGVTVPREIVKNLPDYGRIMSLMSLQRKESAVADKRANSKNNTKATKVSRSDKVTDDFAVTATQQQQQQVPQLFQRRQLAAAAAAHSSTPDSDDDYDPSQDLTINNTAAAAAAATPAAAAGSRGKGKGSSSSRAASNSSNAHTWIQPAACDRLRFDVCALRVALERGIAAKPRMYLSSATLVIVPVTLIPHWQQQIRQHLLPRRLRVIVLGSATAVAAGMDPAAAGGGSSRGGSSSSVKASSSTAAGGGGAAESVCPPAHELAWNYDIVITTFNRLSSDWSLRGDPRLAERMVLLKVHWLRVLIDEGHSLGASLGLTNKLAMAVQLTAERRWVMTGTPTPATAAGSGAAHLQPLLSFLHHQPYGNSRTAWEGAVAKPLEAAAAAAAAAPAGSSSSSKGPGSSGGVLVAEWGRQQLLRLLGRVMIRSCKADLALLPPCYKKVTLLDFGSDHAQSYNALIEVIRRNLLLADWCDDAHYESLLNPKQARWAKEMLGNVRLACCVAGVMNLVPKEGDVLETLELLSGKLDMPKPAKEQHVVTAYTPQPPPAAAVDSDDAPRAAAAAAEQQQQSQGDSPDPPSTTTTSGVVLRQRWFFTGPGHPLHRVEDGLRNGCRCQVCGDETHLPMVTPCGHLLCTDCAAVSRTACPVTTCREKYQMQPVDDPARYKNNPNPKWEVPLDLIEWQPVYHQIGATGLSGGQWSANWRITRSTKVLHLIRRLKEIGIYTTAGKQQHVAAATSASSSLSASGCLRASSTHPSINNSSGSSSSGSVVKAIVFSQFWMHIQLIAAELSARGVRHVFLKRDMPARDKQAAVTAFRASSSSSCLVMDESGALGLDLSFVRYIFLMEPIADAALEQQVVSRAHRMGATAAVHVEVLAMRHTAEEHLVALRHQAASGKLSSTAADAAATYAAAAVAGTAKLQQQQQQQRTDEANPSNQQQQQQQQHGEEPAEELGGANAAAAAVDIANISNFISVGGGGNQMDSRGLRNLLLLHLRKVVVADLPDLPEHLDESLAAAAAAAAEGLDDWGGRRNVSWTGGRGNLLLQEGNAQHNAAAAAAAAAAGDKGRGAMWGDYAVSQQQQQQQLMRVPLDVGEEDDEVADDHLDHDQQQQQVHQVAAAAAAAAMAAESGQQMREQQRMQECQQSQKPKVDFAAQDKQDQQLAAAAASSKPVKRARFADDV